MSTKLRTLDELLLDQIRDLYDAEHQLIKAIPKMADAADNPELKKAFLLHLDQTRAQANRLEQALQLLNQPIRGKTCEAMKGICKEGEEMIDVQAEPDVRDAGLIAAAQKVEHYEIASYGCVCTWAEQLGLSELKQLLGETLEEEKETDAKLSRLAEAKINLSSAAR
jgi:ferritin-like metal-binding protein YciE